jgi:hypothetical protein
MVDAIAKARARLDEVIDRAGQVLGTRRDGTYAEYLNDAAYTEWRMSAKVIFGLLDPGGHCESEFDKIDKDTGWSGKPHRLELQIGVLRALRENFDGDYLSDIRGLVRAEVFADFIEQAQHLFDEGYWQVVPAIVGSVLEDHLRKLCAKHPSIFLPDKPKLDWMNIELVKAKAYGPIEQKQVAFWAGLRNSAAHAKFTEYKALNVEGMLRDVPAFLLAHKL